MVVQAIKNQWIDWIIFLLLLALSPIFLFPSITYSALFFIFPLLLLFKWKRSGRFLEATLLDLALFLLLFQVLISALASPDLLPSLPKISGILLGIFLFYALVALLKSERLIKIGVIVFLFLGVAVSIVGVLDMIRTYKYLEPIDALTALIPKLEFALPGTELGINPNLLGGTVLFIVPLFLVQMYPIVSRKTASFSLFTGGFYFLFVAVGLLISLIILLLTQSRGSWIGLVSCVCLFFMFKGKTGRRIGIVLLIGSILLYFILLGPSEIGVGLQASSRSALVRVDLWNIALVQIAKDPMTGMGLNYFRMLPDFKVDMSHSHNLLLHTATELGIPALIALLAILIGAGYMCVMVWIKSKDGWKKLTVLGLGAGLLAHFIWSMGDAVALGAKAGALFWISLALIAALYNMELFGEKHSEVTGNDQSHKMGTTHRDKFNGFRASTKLEIP